MQGSLPRGCNENVLEEGKDKNNSHEGFHDNTTIQRSYMRSIIRCTGEEETPVTAALSNSAYSILSSGLP
jgi:hypothetical protein